MCSNSVMNMAKGAILGLAAGVCVGVVGKNVVDQNPKLKKKAKKAFRTVENMLDTAQLMFR